MIQGIIKRLFILWVLLSPKVLFAFGLTQHEQITTTTLQQYEVCQIYFPDMLQMISKKHAAILIAANKDIDRLSWLHIGRSLSRLWNWHFYDAALYDEYNPHTGIDSNDVGMERSLHHSFKKKLLQIKQLEPSKDKEFSVLAGEILHFIQDMSVPAHVSPIYHDSFRPDKFDVYVGYDRSKYVAMRKSECFVLLTHPLPPEKQLVDLAKDTIHAITEHISGSQNTWEIFWSLSGQGKRLSDVFNHYGMCGNNFGESKETLNRLPQTCQLEAGVFHDFYLERQQKAVDASLRTLVFLNRK